jgi:aldehyde:ferredoxin oxidoreductase
MKTAKKYNYSYAGEIGFIDLSKSKVSKEPTEKYAQKWIGGRGINTWILFDRLDPETKWSDPENLLCFGVGTLAGTLAPGACRVSVDTKNAFNNGVGSANVGGFWGPELKFAGYDNLIVSGKAEKPVYLWIHDGVIEIRDAAFIWGKTTWETEERIRDELGDERIRVAAIGPAGENKVRSSCIICDRGCAAGGSGCGAVMGSKNLKAIAVRGNMGIDIASPEEFMSLVAKAIKKINKWDLIIDSPTWDWGYRPVKNGQDDYWEKEKIEKICESVFESYRKGTVACFSCPISCKPWLEIDEEPYKVKGEGWWNNSVNSFCTKFDNSHLESAIYTHFLSNQLGLDIDDAAQAISWAFECYEKCLITKEDTDGLELVWGNFEAMIEMLRKLAYREGFGDFLADGAVRAAEKLGKDSWKFVIHVKGQDSLDGVRVNKGWGFGVILSPVGGRHLRGSLGGFWLGGDKPVNSYEEVPEKIYMGQQLKAVQDILGYCSYVYGLDFDDWVALQSRATGKTKSKDQLLYIGLQAHNLEKAFNTIHAGFNRQDDYPCHRYYNESVKSGPYRGERINHKVWEQMLDAHYKLHSWDKTTSWQTRKGLEKIGLADVADMLAKVDRLIDD